jgi:L-lactate dehydrogenase complex protein LldG
LLAGTSAREEILGKISQALESEANSEAAPAKLAPRRGAGAHASSDDARALEIRGRCERERAGLLAQFESELLAIGVRVQQTDSIDAAAEYIERIALERKAKTVVAADAEVVERIGLQKRLGSNGIRYVTEASDADLRSIAIDAGIGVSGVDYALADTGTLVLLARKGQPRSISLVPPVHIAIVKADQVVHGLDDLFGLLSSEKGVNDLGSAVTFITGASRTADIELTLVVGVHGPQELHVVVIPN